MKRLFPVLGVLAACSGDVPQDEDTSQHDAPSCEENAEFCKDTGEDSSGGAEEADSGGADSDVQDSAVEDTSEEILYCADATYQVILDLVLMAVDSTSGEEVPIPLTDLHPSPDSNASDDRRVTSALENWASLVFQRRFLDASAPYGGAVTASIATFESITWAKGQFLLVPGEWSSFQDFPVNPEFTAEDAELFESTPYVLFSWTDAPNLISDPPEDEDYNRNFYFNWLIHLPEEGDYFISLTYAGASDTPYYKVEIMTPTADEDVMAYVSLSSSDVPIRGTVLPAFAELREASTAVVEFIVNANALELGSGFALDALDDENLRGSAVCLY